MFSVLFVILAVALLWCGIVWGSHDPFTRGSGYLYLFLGGASLTLGILPFIVKISHTSDAAIPYAVGGGLLPVVIAFAIRRLSEKRPTDRHDQDQ